MVLLLCSMLVVVVELTRAYELCGIAAAVTVSMYAVLLWLAVCRWTASADACSLFLVCVFFLPYLRSRLDV